MYYAFEGGVRSYYVEGDIEITWAQYVEAVNGMMEGLHVSIANGYFELIYPPVEPLEDPPEEPPIEEPGNED